MRQVIYKVYLINNRGEEHSPVVVYAYDDSKKIQHVASWGKTIVLCDQAAQWADKLKDALGFPESLHAMPNRVEKYKKENNQLKKYIQELEQKIDLKK